MEKTAKASSEVTKNDEIMMRLKVETKPLHDATENHQFQKTLGTGKIKRDDYISYLEQLYSLHSKLANCLDSHKNNSKVEAVVRDRHTDLKALTDDLSCFNISAAEITCLNATKKFIETFQQKGKTSPTSVLGVLYVLEGSTHGAKYMAKTLRSGLKLNEKEGSSYFDRYGSQQMEFWLEFKKDMNNQPFSNEEKEEIVELAKETFNAFSEIGTEILSESN